MAVYQGEIKFYYLYMRSPTRHTKFNKEIHINGDFGSAFINFVPDGEELAINHKRQDADVFEVHDWMSSWDHFVDLLRNEKPVFFFYNDDNKTAELRTNKEPVGDLE